MKKFRGAFLVVIAVTALFILVSCTKSPSPSGLVSPSDTQTESPSSSVSMTPSGSVEPTVSGNNPSASDVPTISPSPSMKQWDPNPISISETSWTNTYTSGSDQILDASIRVPKFTEAKGEMESYYSNFLTDFKKDCENLSKQAKEDGQSVSVGMDFSIECNAGGFVSLMRQKSVDYGGIHPETALFCENFRLLDGKYLTLDDFFTVPREDYFPVLLGVVKEYINERKEDFYDDALTSAEELFPFNAFCVTPLGITLYYDEFSLAPYSIGPIRVLVTWDKIDSVFKLP